MLNIINIEALLILFVGAVLTACQKESEKEVRLPSVNTYQVNKSYDNSLEEYFYTGNGSVTDNGGSSEVTVGFFYSSSSNFATASSTIVSRISGPFSIRLPLEYGQKKYYVRAFAKNSAGIAFGDSVIFITDCFKAPDVSAYYAMLFYLISPSDGDTGMLSTVKLLWNGQEGRIFDVFLDTNPNPAKMVASGLTTKEFDVTGLNRATTYYWKIVMRVPSVPCAVFASKIFRFSTAS